jgi:hypothetical protein
MNKINNIAPCVNVPLLNGSGNRPFTIGAVLFDEMEKPKMIKDLGYIYPKEISKQKRHYAIYECPVCGKEFKTSVGHVNNGHTKSCCSRKDRCGLSDHRLYNIWCNMIKRCYNPKIRHYDRYGGRGIEVCSEWKNDFMLFYNWALGGGYADDLVIDRKDNDGNYEPNNCRWVTLFVNSQNQGMRSNNTSGYRGVSFNCGKWRAQIISNGSHYDLGRFDSKEQAAQAYNYFIIKHGTHHTLNII